MATPVSCSWRAAFDALPPNLLAEMRLEFSNTGVAKLRCGALADALPSPAEIRRIADEAIATEVENNVPTRSMETIKVGKTVDGKLVITDRQELARLENFVTGHPEWVQFCDTGSVLSSLVGAICGGCDGDNSDSTATAPWPRFKEKLNLKPPGTTGFTPHCDSPSLRVTKLASTFVTVMVAIDDMTKETGCLRVVRGDWCEATSIHAAAGSGTNPDGDGRQGQISGAIADYLEWEDLECKSGDIYVFNGWVPHRSSPNQSPKDSRRAVFITYNPLSEGQNCEAYYQAMADLRSAHQLKVVEAFVTN